jgi:hypothetical protein
MFILNILLEADIPARNGDEYQRDYSGFRDNSCGMPIEV